MTCSEDDLRVYVVRELTPLDSTFPMFLHPQRSGLLPWCLHPVSPFLFSLHLATSVGLNKRHPDLSPPPLILLHASLFHSTWHSRPFVPWPQLNFYLCVLCTFCSCSPLLCLPGELLVILQSPTQASGSLWAPAKSSGLGLPLPPSSPGTVFLPLLQPSSGKNAATFRMPLWLLTPTHPAAPPAWHLANIPECSLHR